MRGVMYEKVWFDDSCSKATIKQQLGLEFVKCAGLIINGFYGVVMLSPRAETETHFSPLYETATCLAQARFGFVHDEPG
jgi:hypothetical protein